MVLEKTGESLRPKAAKISVSRSRTVTCFPAPQLTIVQPVDACSAASNKTDAASLACNQSRVSFPVPMKWVLFLLILQQASHRSCFLKPTPKTENKRTIDTKT